MERHLNKLIPESRVGVAHGQMPEANLAEVMVHFNKGDIDVLLCTSIIESGLDIPNANTLIVDRGDTFGLTQLYQLRGRVGRGAQRAYAYFFRHTRKAPTPEGAERLEVIADNAQLGAGYTIAMRDLEMRGAGELLGTRQSGYIADVGFYLYTRLLAQAVRDLRQSQGLSVATQNLLDIKDSRIPVSVDLPLSIGIPMDYVVDQNQRLRLYRRLASIENEEDIQPMMEEFKDRFGQIPDTFIDLLYQIRVKLRAERAGLISVGLEADQVVMRYPSLPEGITSRNLPNLPGLRAGKNAYWLTVEDTNQEWKERLLQVLELIPKA
jgi:transcription-repair coupling factor (superfamily II helicase)